MQNQRGGRKILIEFSPLRQAKSQTFRNGKEKRIAIWYYENNFLRLIESV
jgi:hypothetical protein